MDEVAPTGARGWVVLPKITVPRLLILVGLAVAYAFADLLPVPARWVVGFVAMAGGPALLHRWIRLDGNGGDIGRDDLPDDGGGGRRTWRVRWWVRLVSVAIPLLGMPFARQPQLLNPEWDGLPVTELVIVCSFTRSRPGRLGCISVPVSKSTRTSSAWSTRGKHGPSCVRRSGGFAGSRSPGSPRGVIRLGEPRLTWWLRHDPGARRHWRFHLGMLAVWVSRPAS